MIMKKYILALALVVSSAAFAQHKINSFFDENGSVALETTELKNDTVITIEHRRDDVVWHRVVYRIIDLRYKQNFSLYFPTNLEDPYNKSLFGVMVNAICNGLPVYAADVNGDIVPQLKKENRVYGSEIVSLLKVGSSSDSESGGFDYSAIETDSTEEGGGINMDELKKAASVLEYDSVTNIMRPSDQFDLFVRNQYKFLIREVVFFDKHYSRLYSTIEAIAPLYTPKSEGSEDVYQAIGRQICFWTPFRALRKYLKEQYIITDKNSSKRISYDEFFAKHLYTSYILGDDNVYNRSIPQYYKKEKDIRREQDRIANDLLNFEQNLWEY